MRGDTDEAWRRLQGHVLIDRAGRAVELPPGDRRPDFGDLPPGMWLYATWPSYLFARDAGIRYDCHPLDGSPRPGDGTPPEAMPRGWFLSGDVPLPRAQRPDLVLVRAPAMGPGRFVRNPAWSTLQKYGLLAWSGTLRDFREHCQDGWPNYLQNYAARHPR